MISALNTVFAVSRVGQHYGCASIPALAVHADSLIVFPFENNAAFCALQSRPHEVWVRSFGSSLEERLRYTPTDCFETFPFPHDWATHPHLEQIGGVYYAHRAQLMVTNEQGLTKTYNRFHDPDEDDRAILRLRELHGDMDRAVLATYGWKDIPTDCQFILDYEGDEEDEDRPSRRRKPWRYRWPDEVRDEVLARLLALNAERAAAEEEARKVRGLPS